MLAEQDFIQNVAELNEDMHREAWYGTFFHAFVGDVGVINDPSGEQIKTPSGMPIERLTGFTEANSDNMLIPFAKDLIGPPVFGDTVAKGTGEDQDFRWLRTYVNQTRKVVKAQSGKMSDFRARKLKLIENAKPKLTKWWSKYINQDIWRAFYEGLGGNLSGSKDYDALGVYKRYHPNIYVNAGGVLTVVGTEKAFTDPGQLNNGVTAANYKMSIAIIRALAVKCLQLKIDKIEGKNGYKFWVLVVHPQQLISLKNDTDYEAATNSAFSTRRGDHPMLNGAVCEIEGFAIFSDIVGIRGWDTSSGYFFGDGEADPIAAMFESTTVTDNYCAVVFGNQAIGYGVVESLSFGDEVDDFKNIKEVAGIMIYGANRADFVTEALAVETASGMFYKNTTGGVVADTPCINDSSLILMTDETGT